MKHRIVSISLAVVLALSVGLIGCTSEYVPDITEYNLTISSTEGGSVTTPGVSGPYTYDEGKVVNLVAKADEGYQFVNWTGDVGTIPDVNDATTTITMNGNYSIIANFSQIPVTYYVLTIGVNGSGSTSPAVGQHTYAAGTVVPIIATPASGYRFVNWTGDVATLSCGCQSTAIAMNGDYSVRANFVPVYDLTVVANPVGQGTATDVTNASPYAAGTSVSIKAVAAAGYHFVNWAAPAGTFGNATAAQTTFTMPAQNATITANFAVDLYFRVDAYVLLNGPATLSLEERARCVLLNVMTNIVVDSVRVDLPDGRSVTVPRCTDVFSPDVNWITLFRFITCASGMPIAGGEYIFTGLDEAGEPIPGARNTDIWVGVEPPDPPTNVRAELTEDGILVSWDQSPTIPGSFEPASNPQLGNQQLWIASTETGQAVYGANGMSTSSYLIPRDKANFVEGKDRGISLSEMEDGTYVLGVSVHSIAPKGSLGNGCEYNCSDPSQTIVFTIQDGEVTMG